MRRRHFGTYLHNGCAMRLTDPAVGDGKIQLEKEEGTQADSLTNVCTLRMRPGAGL